MISKRISTRKDGRSSAAAALRYGEGLTPNSKSGVTKDKSHRTRFANFDIIKAGIFAERGTDEMSELIELAAIEMQANCDQNSRVGIDKKLAHFVVSFNQYKPSEAVLRDTEDSMLSSLKLDLNHWTSFLHNDNGFWHLHIMASRIERLKQHRGNSLWQDKTIRDKVCREVEIRHGLQTDNGLHKVDERGEIVEIPRTERRAKRDAKSAEVSDRAKTTETNSGEKSFQSWCLEIRIGDRLKHAKNWQDLHAAAAAYNCEVKPKGAGFVICPLLEKGSIQLSKIGLKNLPAKFGTFEFAKPNRQTQPENKYKPGPTVMKAASHYDKWRKSKDAFKPIKTVQINQLREEHKQVRMDLRAQQKLEIKRICTEAIGIERFSVLSIARMEHSVAITALTETFSRSRQALRDLLDKQKPGNTFRDYLVQEAAKGDDEALELAQRYGADEATDVSRKREIDQLENVAAISGYEFSFALRINYSYQVERNGTVIYDFGQGRVITDSSISKQVQLNAAAANAPEAIAIALRFATAKFGNILTLTGTAEFQRLAVETVVRNGLFIKFSDPVLEQYHKEFSASIFNSPTLKEKQHVEHTKQYSDQRKPTPYRRDRLHCLPELNLDSESARRQMLLQSDVPSGLEQLGGAVIQRRRSRVRQPGLTGRIADKISIRLKPHSYTGVTQMIVAQQEKKMDEQQEIIRSDSTHVQHVASTTKEVKNPVPQNVQVGLVAAKKISKAER